MRRISSRGMPGPTCRTGLVWLAGLLWASSLPAQSDVATPTPHRAVETSGSEAAQPLTEAESAAAAIPPDDWPQGPEIDSARESAECPTPEYPTPVGWPPEGCPEDYGPAHFVTAPHGWWGSVGFLTLTRSLYEISPLYAPVLASPGSYDSTLGSYQWGSGIDLRGGHRDPTEGFFDGWEARYFGVSGIGNHGWANTGGDWTLPGDAMVWPQAILQAGLDSRVQSAEWNLQHDSEVAAFTWLAGVRWLQFDDALWGRATMSPSHSAAFQVSTDNSMYGGQMGLSLALVKDETPLEVDLRLMGGLYANSSQGDWMWKGNAASSGFLQRGADTDRGLAFVGDFEFSFAYRFSERWSAALSYEALWLQGVAVAGDQPELGRLLTSVSGLSTSEAAWFSGLNVGLRFRW
ncbi:MAG: BBP7 family outer membrane beta-barrel protein [Planctomycetaceae bacterium]